MSEILLESLPDGARVFDTPNAVTLQLSTTAGSVTVTADDTGRSTVRVRPADGSPAAARAAAETTVTFAGGHLMVTTPDYRLPVFGGVPKLDIAVSLPTGSSAQIRSGSASVTVHGTLGALLAKVGSGSVQTDDVTGQTDVATGSGSVTLGVVSGQLRARTGSGGISVRSAGESVLQTGSGAVRLGRCSGEVSVRTGSGGIEIGSIGGGTIDLRAGSGWIQLGIASGVLAALDLSSSGKVTSELPVSDGDHEGPADGPTALIKARNGSGGITVRRAVVALA